MNAVPVSKPQLSKTNTSEAEWLSSLAGLRPLEWPEGPVLVVAPHPDDETLGAGGLIAAARQRGQSVTVAAATDGENAYLEPPADARRLGNLRRLEQEQALARLGVSPEQTVRFGLPDSGLKHHEDALEELLAPLIFEASYVVAPWRGDFHPDHEACGQAAARVADRCGARVIFYFFWTWHRGSSALLHGLELRSFSLTPALLRAKQEALAFHHSQLVREGGHPILPEDLLGPARRSFEVFAV